MVIHWNLTFRNFPSNLVVLIYLVMIKLLKILLLLLFLLMILCSNIWRTTRMICICRKEMSWTKYSQDKTAILKKNLPVEPLGILAQPKEDPVFDLKPLP